MTQKFKRRDLILQQANRLFSERGFAATSLEDIAAAVGIKRESLYYYYPGKYDLLYDIIEPQIINTLDNFDRIIAREASNKTAIRRAIDNHLQQFNPSYLHMAMAVRRSSRDEVEQKFSRLRDLFKRYERKWTELVRRAAEAGDIRSDKPPKMVVYSILGLCNSLSSWYRPQGELSLDQIGGHFSDILLDGIGT